jgi:hypothetical protein
MRRWRVALAGLVVAATAVGPTAAAADMTYLGLEDLTCGGVTIHGTGLPTATRLEVAVVDPASRRTLLEGSVTTSASGAFSWRARASLSGRRAVRAVLRRPGQRTSLAWAQQSVPQPCPLASTGPNRSLVLLGAGFGSFTLGLLLLLGFAYRGRHLLRR